MSFINANWYIAMAFCLVFFICGRRLAEFTAEIKRTDPRADTALKLILFAFALPSLLFPLAYLPGPIALSPWYNTFRTINRIELFSALIAPAAGYATFRKPETANDVYRAYRAPGRPPSLRLLKPLAFPFCMVFITVNFISPLIKPIDKGVEFTDAWADGCVYLQTVGSTAGPSALISAMYAVNYYADNELDVVRGTYTDNGGTEFWYLARYAKNRGYGARFVKADGIENAPFPSIIPVPAALAADGAANDGGNEFYIALLGRSESGRLTVADPAAGKREIGAEEFKFLYGEPSIALAISAPRKKTGGAARADDGDF